MEEKSKGSNLFGRLNYINSHASIEGLAIRDVYRDQQAQHIFGRVYRSHQSNLQQVGN